jgi:chaperone required for assembly of F1-ATPase
MREMFEEISANQPLDPTEAARRNMRALRRRFYKDVAIVDDPTGHAIVLDGRPVKTPARRALALPRRVLAETAAEEWRAQTDVIDPAAMPMTRLANTIIDGVAAARDDIEREITKYLGTDLVCYRAMTPAGLVVRQAQHWDPMLAWARDALGAQFALAEGVTHVAQPAAAVKAAAARIPHDPWRLGAVHAIMTLTGSALIALAVAEGALDRDAAWAAAHVDEDWNAELWGRDEIALARRAYRFAEMSAAAQVLAEM